MGALLFLFALLALGGAVQRAAAGPFSSLSPPPALRLVTSAGTTFCVLSASGLDVSSIAAADLAPYRNGSLSCRAVSAIDLRWVAQRRGSRSHRAQLERGQQTNCAHQP